MTDRPVAASATRPRSMPIPESDARTLMIRAGEAHALALEGKFALGHDYLCHGLRHAREVAETQAPWGRSLVSQWEEEIRIYCEMYGVPL